MLEVLPVLDPGCFHVYSSPYQRNDNLTIRVCLEVVRLLQALAEDAVVINLAIDSQRDRLVFADKRLSARVCGCELLLTRSCLWCDHIPTPTMLKRSWTRTGVG
jgi:hypothetical protein